MKDLQQRWMDLWEKEGVHPTIALVAYGRLAQAYGASNRLYHNLGHIRHCLQVFDLVAGLALDRVALEAALWLHDIVFNVHRNDNEEESAQYAQALLKKFRQPERVIENVESLIMATKKHDGELTEPDDQLIADIDLSSLGLPWDIFWLNTKDIQNEYSHVDRAVFGAERAKILQSFLDRPFLYYTPEIKDRYEMQARENLKRSIDLLKEQAAA